MTLPAGLLDRDSNSYRQSSANDPFPGVVLEVASQSDSFDGLLAKAARYSALGVDVYVVSTEPALGTARRLAPGTTEFVSWTGRPIEPLGGVIVEVVDGEVAVRTPDGRVASDDSTLFGQVLTEAVEAKARTVELEAKLRARGVEP